MAPTAVLVESYVLDELFEALLIWEKLEAGRIDEALGPEPIRLATADWCAGGRSYFTRLSNELGFRVARVHYLECPNGGVVRWPSDLVVGDVRLIRVGHQSRPD